MVSLAHVHPILVHFPIVFFLSLAFVDLIASVRGSTVTGRTSLGAVSTAFAAAAGLFAIVAFFFGDAALSIAEDGGFHSDIAEIHEGLGTASAISLAIWALIRAFLWWRDIRIDGGLRSLIPALEIAGVVLLTFTAYYGGELVYGLGVNVAHAATP